MDLIYMAVFVFFAIATAGLIWVCAPGRRAS